MTNMAVITKRNRSREVQWLAAWGAARAAKKNQDEQNAGPDSEHLHDLALVPVLSVAESNVPTVRVQVAVLLRKRRSEGIPQTLDVPTIGGWTLPNESITFGREARVYTTAA